MVVEALNAVIAPATVNRSGAHGAGPPPEKDGRAKEGWDGEKRKRERDRETETEKETETEAETETETEAETEEEEVEEKEKEKEKKKGDMVGQDSRHSD